MNFLDTLAFDMVNTFLADFGEPLIYVSEGSAPISILAIIDREPASVFAGLSQSAGYKHTIVIANDPHFGRTVINKGKDVVIMANKIGGTNETFTVMNILKTDQGAWKLAVG
jgi:hypothetical protein